MKPREYLWHALFTLPLFCLGWLIGEFYWNIWAGFRWAELRNKAS
jgi:hypothetical protein